MSAVCRITYGIPVRSGTTYAGNVNDGDTSALSAVAGRSIIVTAAVVEEEVGETAVSLSRGAWGRLYTKPALWPH